MGMGAASAVGTDGSPAPRYAIRSDTCCFEITSPQTGMYGFVGFFDSPRPWSMIERSRAGVSWLATLLSAGTSGETPPRPRSPWHCAHANSEKSCAPAATCGSIGADEEEDAGPANVTVRV